MLTDEWAGLRVHRSADLRTWEPHHRILAESGPGEDDGGNGLHADVVVVGDDAFVFYFTHPGRRPGEQPRDSLYPHRSCRQAARERLRPRRPPPSSCNTNRSRLAYTPRRSGPDR